VRLRLVGVAALLALLATLAVLLALDVGAWNDALHSGDARYRASPAAARWRAAPILPFGTAKSVLGVGDDLAARRAIRLFRLSYRAHGTLDTAVRTQGARAAAELALADVARSGDVRRAAQASDLLGVLAFGDVSRGGGAATQADRAVSAFANAVRLDPSDEAAKFNLELALRLFQARGVRPGASQSTGGRGTGRHGAGTGLPGSGY
jgi:hypothetical protein